jgi:hypothetical protein
MRKLSKARDAVRKARAVDVELHDTRPRRIQGSTITSWPAPIDAELLLVLGKPLGGATIAGASAGSGSPESSASRTVSLSDGTCITFTTAGQFSVLQTV